MWESITSLFDGFGVIAMIIFAVGIVFCIVEIFIPGFGVFGITGTIFIAAGIVVRYLLDFNLEHLIFMILFVIVFVFLTAMIMIFAAKYGLLRNSPIIVANTSISTDYSNDNKEYVKMLGKIVFCETNFSPAGRFALNGDVFDATSYGEYYEKGTKVKIVEVNGETIYVRKEN